MMTCARCGEPIPQKRQNYRNRFGPVRYCSPGCNRAAVKARAKERAATG